MVSNPPLGWDQGVDIDQDRLGNLHVQHVWGPALEQVCNLLHYVLSCSVILAYLSVWIRHTKRRRLLFFVSR